MNYLLPPYIQYLLSSIYRASIWVSVLDQFSSNFNRNSPPGQKTDGYFTTTIGASISFVVQQIEEWTTITDRIKFSVAKYPQLLLFGTVAYAYNIKLAELKMK
jgi:hypothetical protein